MSQAATGTPAEKTLPSEDFLRKVAACFKDLQERICASYEAFEPSACFEVTPWVKDGTVEEGGRRLAGGGERRIMRGQVFEKVGVNFSNVHGTFVEGFRTEIPGADQSGGSFTACGVSLVTHMANPRCPSVHMNVRMLSTSQAWFGGGADLTPTFEYKEDTAEFHAALKAACDSYRADAYDEYKKWCDDYFYLHHRKEPRGVGGIFFDNLNSGDAEKDFAFVKAVGEAFYTVYPKIVARRKDIPFTEADKDAQLYKRGRYAEFNLVYDRGTKFGFATGADPENFLMSLPPVAKW